METAFRQVIDRRGIVAANASAWNTTETKRTVDLFARTLNIFKDDLRSILAEQMEGG